ncbi:hypothetical protein PR202_gb15920 [Eleusine coracana subsp. coracana]|uniref:Uncharacterized protein n=1 Tax=Eleusine coracana subsp. coracana TaxID=191504 RepID=A0AAV5EWT9_ELECO|nr:hypothetical protein PR202_gb15920 [Eleusine coracana subsp. coracana]
MGWGFIITPLTFTQMVRQNALQCTKAALEGKAPELLGFRANPNCMNRFGYFPLHQAAEIFSVDMVKLLLSYGALANVRTAGPEIIEGLLPLHVAVENTCLHKYLEGNAFPNKGDLNGYQANVYYICKLIHLLCLPEMVPHNMQVPHDEVLEKVSSILNGHCFCPTGGSINIGNLCSYKHVLSAKELPNEPDLLWTMRQVVRNKTPRGWELKYARSFFPYWRSVLMSKLPCKVIRLDDMPTIEELQGSQNKSAGKGSSLIPNANLGPLAWIHQSINQPKRTFCSTAFPLLKAFRNA